jgi:hypothetical protein
VIDDDAVIHLEKAEFTLESAFGSVEPVDRAVDIDDAIRTAKDERAERAARRLQDS